MAWVMHKIRNYIEIAKVIIRVLSKSTALFLKVKTEL